MQRYITILALLAALLLLPVMQATAQVWTKPARDDPEPTPTAYTIFIPSGRSSAQQTTQARGLLALVPAPWRPFLQRYGTVVLLILAIIIFEGLQSWKKRRPPTPPSTTCTHHRL